MKDLLASSILYVNEITNQWITSTSRNISFRIFDKLVFQSLLKYYDLNCNTTFLILIGTLCILLNLFFDTPWKIKYTKKYYTYTFWKFDKINCLTKIKKGGCGKPHILIHFYLLIIIDVLRCLFVLFFFSFFLPCNTSGQRYSPYLELYTRWSYLYKKTLLDCVSCETV